MKSRRQTISCFLAGLMFLVGCVGGSYKEKLTKLKPNMSKDELLLIMKEPGVVRSSEVGKSGKHTEVWEYNFTSSIMDDEPVIFYFEFTDDRLVKWGKKK